MVVISEKSHAEYYRDRMMPRSSDAQPVHSSPYTWTSQDFEKANYFHDIGLIEKLACRLASCKLALWLGKDAD